MWQTFFSRIVSNKDEIVEEQPSVMKVRNAQQKMGNTTLEECFHLYTQEEEVKANTNRSNSHLAIYWFLNIIFLSTIMSVIFSEVWNSIPINGNFILKKKKKKSFLSHNNIYIYIYIYIFVYKKMPTRMRRRL